MREPWRSNSVRSSEEVMLLFCFSGGLAGAGSGVSLLTGGGAVLERTLTTAAVPEALNTHTSSLHINTLKILVEQCNKFFLTTFINDLKWLELIYEKEINQSTNNSLLLASGPQESLAFSSQTKH